jgi:hypothetical protein
MTDAAAVAFCCDPSPRPREVRLFAHAITATEAAMTPSEIPYDHHFFAILPTLPCACSVRL